MSAVGNVNNNTNTDTTRVPSKTMSQADFLKVLVAQYSNQIPSDSQNSTDFYTQMMSMSNYSAIQDVSTKMSSMSAAQMIGKYVSATNDNGDTVTGTVTSARYDSDNTVWMFKIGSEEVKATQINQVTTAPATTPTTST